MKDILGYVLPFFISLITLYLNFKKDDKKNNRTILDDENDRLNERVKRLTDRVDQLEDENDRLRKELNKNDS